MPTSLTNRPISGYIELASPQILDDKWCDLNFDFASGQNVLQDMIMPGSGGGYVYRDARSVGSATHNRFLYWRTVNDVLELVEISTEHVLENNQVRITFPNSPVLSRVTMMEFSDSIVIMLATLTSVHRFDLPHPKVTTKSILHELTTDLLFNPANYYILNTQNSINNQQPICATSWYDKNSVKCALSFPDSSILIVQFGRNTHQISLCEIKQVGIIGRLLSKMPSILGRGANECDNAVFISTSYHHPQTNDVLLLALCKDWRLRVFSTTTRECIYTFNVINQNNLTQSFSMHTNQTTDLPMMKMYGSHIVIYQTENRPEFLLLLYSFRDGFHEIREIATFQTPSWVKLIDFSLTDKKLWALANVREAETVLCHLNLCSILEGVETEDFEEVWDFVNFVDDIEIPSARNYVAEIFWRNHFSVATVSKAIVGVTGPFVPKKPSMNALEELAYTRIVDENQDEAWARFYNYCLQNHHAANKSIGLVTAADESVISIVKRSNPSFICPLLMSVDMFIQGGPYRGIEFSNNIRSISRPLDYISTELIDDEHANMFEQRLFEDPAYVSESIADIVESLSRDKEINQAKLNLNQKNLITPGIDFISEQLDLTTQSNEFGSKILQESSFNIRSEHNPLESNSGIIITFELFKRLARARMILARDLLIYISLLQKLSDSEFDETSLLLKVRRITDSLRSYALLLWIAESPVKTVTYQANPEVIDFVSSEFKFFKKAAPARDGSQDSTLDLVLHQNLLMNFLINGGVAFSSSIDDLSRQPQTLSNSFYVTQVVLNLFRLAWPKSDYMCFAEFLLTHQLDDHLDKYLNLTEDWLINCEYDRHFLRASNYLLQNRATLAVEIFNKLWVQMNYVNLIGRFIGLDSERPDSSDDNNVSVAPSLIYRYHDKLTQLFQIQNNYHCLIVIINQCISLLDENGDVEQQHWVNCLRAKLFMCYLELEDSDAAYNTMVLTSDPSLRTNCLRKFIVSHCENEQWAALLSYPFVDIKNDFIDILNQKAESSDLSKLVKPRHYETSYYDLLFAFYISHEEYVKAASVMYDYAQRLACEVPGIISIRKQADSLLTALNSLRCVNDKEAYIESATSCSREEGRSSVLKRGYDCESETSVQITSPTGDGPPSIDHKSKVRCIDIKMKYELTLARLRLLEKDQTANAIALSPLKPEETVAQLVGSSMFPAAIDLAILFRLPMENVLEGLTAKYISILHLSAMDIALHGDLEGELSDIFTNSYSIIDTYNYIANSTASFVDKLWRLIDYYLRSYDGVSHTYSEDTFKGTFGGTTVLMRVVAEKILSSGCDIPASVKQMYMSRNTSELLRLLIKYDRLEPAADLAVEMVDRLLEPANSLAFTSQRSEPPPIYLPTHLINSLISFLSEDATNSYNCRIGEHLSEKLNEYRRFLESV